MRKSLILILLAVACCLVFSQDTKADVNTVAQVFYYEPTNSMWAWAETMPDYDTLSYYCINEEAWVSKDGVEQLGFSGSSCENSVYNEAFLPYDPEADYTIEASPRLTLRHYAADNWRYDDYYYYSHWNIGDPIFFPGSFSFSGTGPDVPITDGYLILGTIFSVFTDGATSGPPHHLKVITDQTITETNNGCTRAKKLIDYQIVDANNRPAGRVPIDEKPLDYTLIDSCSNQQVALTHCTDLPITSTGVFLDSLRTGCPNSGTSPDCGFDLVNTWRWCRRGGPYYYDSVPLARVYYDVRRTYVTVDGEQDITDGAHKYP